MIAPKRVSDGKYIDLSKFNKDDVDIVDINNSLNYIYRFTGHWKNRPPLTVAQHTKLVIHLAQTIFPDEPDVHFDCLLHDMPEAYYGDIATPLKRLFGEEYREYTGIIDKAVYDTLWTIEAPFTEEIEQKRKICDLLSLDIERRSMWNSQVGKGLWPIIPMEGFFSLKEKIELFDEIQSIRIVDLKHLYNKSIMSDGKMEIMI